MEKMHMESVDITVQNIEKLGALFPNCITEMLDEEQSTIEKKVYKKAVNFELLKQMLSGNVLDGDEAYEFTWVGKKASIVEANKPIRKTLRPCKEESIDWDTTENLYIEGDNLEVLKLLQESYLGKVKMIYIDPPYNTGSDLIYRDDFNVSSEKFQQEIGEFDENGNHLFVNNDTNGRFHSDWCSMIYPRLLLARNLLAENGVIFISIDDNEIDSLRKICDEIFGASNFLACIVWQKKTSPDARMNISAAHDYIVVYAKNIYSNKFLFNSLPYDESRLSNYKNPDNDPRGPWASVDITGQTGRAPASQFYEITTPAGVKYYPPEGRCWAMAESTFISLYNDNRLWFGADGTNRPRQKKFLSESDGQRPWTWWDNKFASYNQASNKELMELFDGKVVFDNPKPTQLLMRMLELSTNDNSGDIILDFFSGSATTAHTVMLANAKKNGNRKYICIQIPQALGDSGNNFKANNVAIQMGFSNICEIGKERIRRAGKKIKDESPFTTQDLDTGFRVLRLSDSNMNDVYYSPTDYSQDLLPMLESNVKSDRNDLDLLFGCLLEWGLPLSLPYCSEQIEGYTVHNYNDGDLIACFEEDVPDSVIKEIAKRQPLRAIFRDSSFANSPSKINVEEIFKLMAPDTRVKVI
mgnify:CR=1 FL=1